MAFSIYEIARVTCNCLWQLRLLGTTMILVKNRKLICRVKPLSITTSSEFRPFDLGQILTTMTYPYFFLKLLQGRIDQVFVQ